MKKHIYVILLLAVILFAGCSPAFVGVSGNALLSTGPYDAMISVNAPLELATYGRMLTGIKSDSTVDATAKVTYAVYSDAKNGPVNVHAHSMIVNLPSSSIWRFSFQSGFRNILPISSLGVEENGVVWNAEMLFIPAEEDWVSRLWQQNGRSIPKIWITKRWQTTNVKRDTRFIAEYREELPLCMLSGEPVKGEDIYSGIKTVLKPSELLGKECHQTIKAFEARADKSFNFSRGKNVQQVAPGVTDKFDVPMINNANRLIGNVDMLDREDLFLR